MMKFIAYILAVHIIYNAFTANITLNQRKEELSKLQKQRYDLFRLINLAINETVTALEKSNETDAKQGILFMKDLKKELKEINRTEVDTADMAENCSGETKGKNNATALKIERRTAFNDRLKPRILDFAKLFQKHSALKKDKYIKYRDEVHKKVEEWIEQREREKAKIREYKLRQRAQNRIKKEHCPDHGTGDKKGKKGKGKKDPKYPCCRKCCKKSYMGCL